MKELFKELSGVSLFKGMTSEEIEERLHKRNYSVKKYAKGEMVAFRGDETDGLYINLKGELTTEMMKESGAAQKIENIGEKRIIASAFIFGKMSKFPVDLIVKRDCEIFYISKEELLKLMSNEERILTSFLDEVSNKAQFLSAKVWSTFNNKSINEKIVSYIMKNEEQGEFQFKPSLKDVADMFGIARPSLSRVLTEFVDEGILERSGRNRYKILDMELLKEKTQY